MSREVCGICWCPYDEFTGGCACPPASVQKSTLRTAAQQALEALELAQTDVYWELNSPTRNFLRKAEKNLRAALAEPEPVQEPVGMVDFLTDLQRSRMKYPDNRRMFDGLMGEVDELRRAYAGDGDIRAEAFDVAVCAFRIATEGDSGGNTMLKQAALAEPVQEPVCRDDGMPTSAEEGHLRRLLALRAAMPHAYYDDGEAQGTEHGISIDFMREPVAHIDAKLRALNVARAIAKQAEPVQEPEPVAWMTPGQDLHLNNGEGFRFSDWTPLYTSPPQRLPLTDEEIMAVIKEEFPHGRIFPLSTIEFARAIERAHGITP